MVQTNSTDSHQTEKAFDAKDFCVNLPHQPGVYRMINIQGEVIYVGKAVNLKNAFHPIFKKPIWGLESR